MDIANHDRAGLGNSEYGNPAPSRNYFRIVIERKWYIVLGVVLALVIGAIFYTQQTPVYSATMQVLLIKKGDILPAPGLDRTPVQEDYVATQLALIKTPLVLDKVAKRPEIKDYPWAANPSQAAAYVNAGLTVKSLLGEKAPSSGSSILLFSFTSPDNREGDPVLRAVYEGYKEFLDETYKDVSKTTIDLITKAKDVLEVNLQEEEKKYREFREKMPLGRLKLTKDGNTLNGERLIAFQGRLSALLMRKGEIEGHLKSLERARQRGLSRANLLDIASRFSRTSSTLLGDLSPNPNGDRTGTTPEQSRDQLLLLKVQEDELLRDVGPDHPDVKQVQQRMRTLTSFLALKGIVVDLSLNNNKPGSSTDPLETHEKGLRQEIDEIDQTADSYSKILTGEVAQAKDLISSEMEEETLVNRRDRTRELYKVVVSRLSEIDLVKDTGGFRSGIIVPPPPVGRRTATTVQTVFAISTLCGLLAGFGLACLAEISDHSFRSPTDIVTRLGVKVVGHVPTNEEAAGKTKAVTLGVSPMLWTHHRSKSRYAEAFREIRTYLYFSNRDSKSVAIQVTSSRAGDGKTTVASNLAVCIAQSGKKVLIMDADCRRPRVHKLFGQKNDKGLTSILANGMPVADATITCDVPGLSILMSGPSVLNPAELLTSPAFAELITKLKQDYDYVIVDTPPILAVSDPSVVASLVDGVLLVVRLGKNERVDAERATQMLQGLGGNLLGVIVNGIGSGKQGYGYRYGYGYGYGSRSYYYGGSYGGYYEKQRDGAYYDDETDKEVVTAKSAFEKNEKNGDMDDSVPDTEDAFVSAEVRRTPVSRFFSWLRGE